MSMHIILVLCLIIQYSQVIGSRYPRGQAPGLKKEASMEEKIERYLKKTGQYVPFYRKAQRWANMWMKTKRAPKVKMTKRQHKWWDELVYRKKPRKPKSTLKRRRGRMRYARMTTTTPARQRYQRLTTTTQAQRRYPRQTTCDEIPMPGVMRMEWRRMSTTVRNSFRDAVNRLARFIPDPNQIETSAYDIFVEWHNFANSPGAHLGAAFLPWHREFLWRFENALRQQGYQYGLPFWDSSLDALLPDPSNSTLFTTEQLGINRGAVTTWGGTPTDITAPSSCSIQGSSLLQRDVIPGPTTDLISRNDVMAILALGCYRDLTWGWDQTFEGHHNNGHLWFGDDAQMSDAFCSPVDPIFWMHHAYVDLIWEEYRESQDPRRRELDYPQTNLGEQPGDMAWNSVMKPFSGDTGFGLSGTRLLNIHGLSNHYTSYYYKYETRPSSIMCASDEDCNGDGPGLLWCFTDSQLCYAKIQTGGPCSNAWPSTQCYCSSSNDTPVCSGNICQCHLSPAPPPQSTTTTAADYYF